GYTTGYASCEITVSAYPILDIFMPSVPWRMFRFDLNRTGFSNSTAPSTSSILWNYTVGTEIHSSASVVDGKVFFGARDGKIYCLDENTGIVLWEYTTGASPWGVCSSPAVVGSRVFVGSGDKKLYCLNATTGKLLWDFSTQGEVYSSPAVARGKVFFGSCDGKLYCLNESTGNIVWSFSTGNEIYSSPALSQGNVFIGTGSDIEHTVHKIYCVNEDTGTLVWSYNCGDAVISSPAVGDGKVFFGSIDSKVYCLNATTGEHVWNYSTGAPIWSSPAIANGKIFIGSLDDILYCLNATTGECLWDYSTGDDVYSSPAVAESKVFIGSRSGIIYCLDEDTGAVIWNYTTGFSVHGITSSPVVADGKLFVGSCDGKFYCFGKVTRSPLSVSLHVEPSSIYSNESSMVTVHVTSNNLPVAGAYVTLLASVGTLSPAIGVTDELGNFTSTYLAPPVTFTQDYTIKAVATKTGYFTGENTTKITLLSTTLPTLTVSLSLKPSSVRFGKTSVVTVYVSHENTKISNATVSISATSGSLSRLSGVTDENGTLTVTFTAPITLLDGDCILNAVATKPGYAPGQATANVLVKGIWLYATLVAIALLDLGLFALILRRRRFKKTDFRRQ
ncbi:MAG: PQQ-binding-like beta-propeller repeat protein, partial [Candidatus Thermoplasmatota archaeon]|nr:PQQ-binding-like beta-propeller repeat protein [Candidatus Thermoplasmatota archaeon]